MVTGACGGGRSPSAPSDVTPPGATQACRVFATEWSSTYTFAAPTTSSASFNAVDRTYTEFSPAGSSQAVRRVTYGSVADFIDEAAVFGRFLSRRTETCPARENCTSGLPPSALLAVEVPSYDNQRRRTGLTAQLNGAICTGRLYPMGQPGPSHFRSRGRCHNRARCRCQPRTTRPRARWQWGRRGQVLVRSASASHLRSLKDSTRTATSSARRMSREARPRP